MKKENIIKKLINHSVCNGSVKIRSIEEPLDVELTLENIKKIGSLYQYV